MQQVENKFHKRALIVSIEEGEGPFGQGCHPSSRGVAPIRERIELPLPLRVSTGFSRFHELLSLLVEVVLAHPRRVPETPDGRARSDKLELKFLAKILRAGLVPEAQVFFRPYYQLSDPTGTRIPRFRTRAKNELYAVLTHGDIQVPHKISFRKRLARFVSRIYLGPAVRANARNFFSLSTRLGASALPREAHHALTFASGTNGARFGCAVQMISRPNDFRGYGFS